MFEELQTEIITELYKEYKGIFLTSTTEQLTLAGYVLDLNSLPTHPIPFKELFIRWLISVNRQRIENGQGVFVSRELVLRCPLWRVIACPIKKLTLTQEQMFNRPHGSRGTIGSRPTRSINRRSR